MSIEIRGVTKVFGTHTALDDVTLAIEAGELVAFLGPSGSGKTTLLRLMAGLEFPDRGQVLLDGAEVGALRARDRRVGFVFQHYALFRQMTVFDNVAFGLQVRPRALRPSKAAIRARVHELLRLVQLEELVERYPAQLSGGQRQRVAVARALAVEPRVLLLDEPFGALDLRVRQELRRWLRRLQAELGLTTVLVTHDQEEALEVADRVVVLHEGRIAQVGTPAAVYDDPVSPFVCGFLGDVNRLICQVAGSRARIEDLEVAVPPGSALPPGECVAYVRPHDLVVRRPQDGAAGLAATIRRVQAVGPTVRLELASRDSDAALEAHLDAQVWRDLGLLVGETALVVPRRLRVFGPGPVDLLIAAELSAVPAPATGLPV